MIGQGCAIGSGCCEPSLACGPYDPAGPLVLGVTVPEKDAVLSFGQPLWGNQSVDP